MQIRGLDNWVDKLARSELPVLANVVRELNELTGDDDTEVNQLADVILRDANLTSQVLRIANSVTYNPSHYPINTVSRAIILIGFTGVRAICVSAMIIDSLLGKRPREHLQRQMALSFHRAVLARCLMRKTREVVREEVFIAGLLLRLAELAFWSAGGKYADRLEELLGAELADPREAEEEVLGCSFRSLTRALAESWKLGETLEQAVYPPAEPAPKVEAVLIAEEVTQAALLGWQSDTMDSALQRVANFTGLSMTEARQLAVGASQDAAGVAVTFGVAEICHLIPGPDPDRERAQVVDAGSVQLQSNPQLQLEVLRDLGNAVLENLDVNSVFQLVLEGLHRGVGLERVVLAFVQKQEVVGKFFLGTGVENWRRDFRFGCPPDHRHLLAVVSRSDKPMRVTATDVRQHPEYWDGRVGEVIGRYPAFVSGIRIGGRCVALFYADRHDSGGDLTEEQFQSFSHFMMQTEMSLRMISERRARG